MAEDDSASVQSGDMESKRPFALALLGSNLFGLVIGGLYEYLSLRGVVSMKLAWTVLAFVWIVGVIAIITSEWLLGRNTKHKIRWGVTASVLLALLLFGFHKTVSWFVRPPVAMPVLPLTPPGQPQVVVSGNCSVGSIGNGNTISSDCSKGSKEKKKRE